MPNWFLDHVDALVTIVTLLVVSVTWLYVRRISSTSIVAISFLLVQGLSVLLTQHIRDVLSQSNVELARMAFYFSFAFADLIAISLIASIHKRCVISFEPVATFTVFALKFLAVLQVVRYFDRQTVDVLGTVYQYSIPILNIAIVLLLVRSTYDLVNNQLKMTGVKNV